VIFETSLTQRLALCAFLTAAAACGSSSPTSPGGGGGSGGPGPVGATVTIGANDAVSPASVTINPGESVTFVNNGSQPHEITSNPHPAHTDCPAINAVGLLSPGQTRTTNALTTSRSCGYHDHRDDSNNALRGTIVIR
jgi:plastocyanin